MKKIRIIPRLDVKGPNVVKSLMMEGLRVVGNPKTLAKKYYEDGAEEIFYIDTHSEKENGEWRLRHQVISLNEAHCVEK